MTFLEIISTSWPMIGAISVAIAGIGVLFQNVQTIRKLQLEIIKLKNEKLRAESKIIRPTANEIEKYTSTKANSIKIMSVALSLITFGSISFTTLYVAKKSEIEAGKMIIESQRFKLIIRNYERAERRLCNEVLNKNFNQEKINNTDLKNFIENLRIDCEAEETKLN